MSVYGGFLTAFPELHRSLKVFTKEDKSDIRTIRAVYMPTRGDRLERQKFTSRGKALQYFEDDSLFVGKAFIDKIRVGDYFYSPNDETLQKVVGQAEWQFEGGFTRFVTERVTGTNVDQQDELKVKEAQFA